MGLVLFLIIALAAVAFFICLLETIYYLKLERWEVFPAQPLSALLVFLYLLLVFINRDNATPGAHAEGLLRIELISQQLSLIGFILAVGRRSFLHERLFSISGVAVIALITLVTAFLPDRILFGQISQAGNLTQSFSPQMPDPSAGMLVWQFISSLSLIVFLLSTFYMALRKSNSEFRAFLWAVYSALGLILAAAIYDHVTFYSCHSCASLVPFSLSLYLIILFIITSSLGIRDYKIHKSKMLADLGFRNLVSQANVSIVMLNRMGHIEYVNDHFLVISGYREEDVIGKDWFEFFITPKDYFEIQSAFIELLEYEFHPFYRNKILTKSGKELEMDWYNVRLRDEEGKIRGSMSVGVDATSATTLK
jgi:PAS domain S-box-containing protein